jgi:hypothetical protein
MTPVLGDLDDTDLLTHEARRADRVTPTAPGSVAAASAAPATSASATAAPWAARRAPTSYPIPRPLR